MSNLRSNKPNDLKFETDGIIFFLTSSPPLLLVPNGVPPHPVGLPSLSPHSLSVSSAATGGSDVRIKGSKILT